MTNIEIGILCTLGGLLIAWAGYRLNARRETKDEGRESGAVMTELGYIKSGIDDIKSEQKDQRQANTEMRERLASVEASAQQAHHRIDRLEGREGREGKE